MHAIIRVGGQDAPGLYSALLLLLLLCGIKEFQISVRESGDDP
jgi:hypothetical protein